jgi:hypothetical protein
MEIGRWFHEVKYWPYEFYVVAGPVISFPLTVECKDMLIFFFTVLDEQ